MAALGSQSIASSFEQLLHVDADGGGNGTTHVSVKDGDNGTTFGFTIATDALMMTGTNRLEFGDTGTYIHQSADGVLDLVSDTELELNATTIDMNGAVDISGVTVLNSNCGIGDTDPSEAKLSIDNVQSGDVGINLKNTQATTALKIDQDGNGSAIRIDSESTTTATVFAAVNANSLTTGKVAYFHSDSSDPSTRNLVEITNDNTAASGATALHIQQDANQKAFVIDSAATTNHVMRIDGPTNTSGSCILVDDVNSITTGSIASFNSNSPDNSARNLVQVINDNTSATGAVGLYLQNDASAGAELISGYSDARHFLLRHRAGNASYDSTIIMSEANRTADPNFAYYRGQSDADGSPDVEFLARGDGVVAGDGAYSVGADYAEYFESKNGLALEIGTTVKLDGEKIVACEDGDNPIGVIRPFGASTTVGNTNWNRWGSKYLKDDYGAYIYEEYSVSEWEENTDVIKKEAIEEVLYVEGDDIPEGKEIGDVKIEAQDVVYETKKVQYHTDKIPSNVSVPSDAIVISEEENGSKLMRKKLNPDYDDSINYIPREKRDEWNIVGLMGQIEITKGQPTSSNWIKMKDISETVELWFVK